MIARLGLALILLAGPALAQPDEPLTPERLNQLRAAYDDRTRLDIPGLVAGLKSEDPAVRARTTHEIRALLDQALADDTPAPAPWKHGDDWNRWVVSNEQSPARRVRDGILRALREDVGDDAAIPALRWFVRRERTRFERFELAEIVERQRGAAWDAFVVWCVANAEDTSFLKQAALREAGTRKLPIPDGELARLLRHYSRELVEAARILARALGRPDPGPRDPAAAVRTPAFAALMKRARSCIPWLPPADAEYAVITYRHRDYDEPRKLRGWILAQDEEAFEFFTVRGLRYRLRRKTPRNSATYAPRKLADEIAWIHAQREKARRDERDQPIFEHNGGYGPEACEFVLGCWLFEHGRFDRVADLMLPAVDSGERRCGHDPVAPLRDLLGEHWGQQMIGAFAAERNLQKTARLAREILRCLPGTVHATTARRLLAERPRHRDDFGKLALPTPAEWKKLEADLSRPEAIRYLAARLHLLTGMQHAHRFSGNNGYLDCPQPTRVTGPLPALWWCERTVDHGPFRINPYRRLAGEDDDESERRIGGMKLTVDDIPLLAPFLLRDLHLRTIHVRGSNNWDAPIHVRHVVAELINQAADLVVVDAALFDGWTPEAQRREVKRLADWAREHGGQSEGDRLLSALVAGARTGRTYCTGYQDGMIHIADRLIELGRKDAAPVILRYGDLPSSSIRDRVLIVYQAAKLDPRVALPKAIAFTRHHSEWVRLQGALLILEHGDAAPALHLIEQLLQTALTRRRLASFLTYPPDRLTADMVSGCVATLLARRSAEGRRIARLVFEGDALEREKGLGAARAKILAIFVVAGLPDAYRYALRRLPRLGFVGRRALAIEFVTRVAKGRAPPEVMPKGPAKVVSIPAFTAWLERELRRIEARGD